MAARSTSYGRYEIVGPLASGGMADLDLARASGPSGFESLAVVKRIRPHLAVNPDFVRLFLGEARLAAGLRHPNVVAVYDAGQERGEYYFVMEFVHGRDLPRSSSIALARKRALSFDEVVTIAVGVCAGLHHAHEATTATGGRSASCTATSRRRTFSSASTARSSSPTSASPSRRNIQKGGTNTLRAS